MVKPIQIAGRLVGPNHPCFIIAEAGVNHNGDLKMARQLVNVAAAAGADAVKFQTFKAERLVTTGAPKADYQVVTTGTDESQLDMLRRLELSDEDQKGLFKYCEEQGITCLSTPFDEISADFLDSLGVPAFKVPSGELTNLPLLAHIAAKGMPMIISTGMATLDEVELAVAVTRENGNDQLVLLHCVSCYPAKASDVNLRAIATMENAFSVPVGYSDHTVGIEVSLAAAALGACIIEKHVTMDRLLPGPDHHMSLEPTEFDAMVRGIRIVEQALGTGRKMPTVTEANVASVARKSLVAAVPIAAGSILTDDLIRIKRPGTVLPPSAKGNIIGRRARTDIPAGALLTFEMLT